jgi:hypothetical protein
MNVGAALPLALSSSLLMQRHEMEGLAAAACNWEAKSGQCSTRCSIELLHSKIAVKTLSDVGSTPNLSTISVGQTRGILIGVLQC